LTIDFLKIAVSELGNISERRVFNLLSGKRGLPPFLSLNPGLNSGLMILQYTSASLVSANKQLSSPSSTDSITSSNGQEDHVSMGANGANQLRDIINNLYNILAIELIVAIQAKEFNSHKPSKKIKEFILKFREISPVINDDRILYKDISKVSEFVRSELIMDPLF
jgi:histidine ammonia-lyase